MPRRSTRAAQSQRSLPDIWTTRGRVSCASVPSRAERCQPKRHSRPSVTTRPRTRGYTETVESGDRSATPRAPVGSVFRSFKSFRVERHESAIATDQSRTPRRADGSSGENETNAPEHELDDGQAPANGQIAAAAGQRSPTSVARRTRPSRGDSLITGCRDGATANEPPDE